MDVDFWGQDVLSILLPGTAEPKVCKKIFLSWSVCPLGFSGEKDFKKQEGCYVVQYRP